MAKLRFPGRPGQKHDKTGILYRSKEAKHVQDNLPWFVATIRRGLKQFEELVGPSDEEDEDFEGFELGDLKSAERKLKEKLQELDSSSDDEDDFVRGTRLARAKKSLAALPAAERTRNKIKTVVRQSYKEMIKEGLVTPQKSHYVKKLSGLSTSQEKPVKKQERGKPMKFKLDVKHKTGVSFEDKKKRFISEKFSKRKENDLPAKVSVKRTDKNLAKQLLHRAKHGRQPVSSKSVEKVSPAHPKKQFILPTQSSRSSRMIKPNKRFIEEDIPVVVKKKPKPEVLQNKTSDSPRQKGQGQPKLDASLASGIESVQHIGTRPAGLFDQPLVVEGKRDRKRSSKMNAYDDLATSFNSSDSDFEAMSPTSGRKDIASAVFPTSPLTASKFVPDLFSNVIPNTAFQKASAKQKLGMIDLGSRKHGSSILRKAKLQLNRAALNKSKAALAKSLKAQMKREARIEGERHTENQSAFTPLMASSNLSGSSSDSGKEFVSPKSRAKRIYTKKPRCAVCREKTNATAFGGVLCCEQCRKFYTVQKKYAGVRERLCKRGGSCKITPQNKKICVPCRLKKCLLVFPSDSASPKAGLVKVYSTTSVDSPSSKKQTEMGFPELPGREVIPGVSVPLTLSGEKREKMRKKRQAFQELLRTKQERVGSPMDESMDTLKPDSEPEPVPSPDDASSRSPRNARGPRIKHVCRNAAVVLGKPVAKFAPKSEIRLSALPVKEKKQILKDDEAKRADTSDDERPLEEIIHDADDSITLVRKTSPPKPYKPGKKLPSIGKIGKRKIRCKTCAGCLATDCGVCRYCLDKPKFGGRGIMKQACEQRRCSKPIYGRAATVAFLDLQKKKRRQAATNRGSELVSGSDTDSLVSSTLSNHSSPQKMAGSMQGTSATGGQQDGVLKCQSLNSAGNQQLNSGNTRSSLGTSAAGSEVRRLDFGSVPSVDISSPSSYRLASGFSGAGDPNKMDGRGRRLGDGLKGSKFKEKALGRGEQVVLQSVIPASRQLANSLQNRIKADFRETTTIATAWRYGMALTTSSSLCVRALCYLCGSAGKHDLLYCSVCCEPFHEFCLDEDESYSREDSENWCCRKCRFCHVCGRQNNLLQCDKCHDTYHPECLGPNYPTKPSKRKGIWICTKCVKCKSCGATTPGNAWNATWTYDFSLCFECGQLMDKGNFCPVCRKCYTDDDWESKMIQCGMCDSWVHARCEGLSDEMYDILSFMPEDLSFNCRRCCPTGSREWEGILQKELVTGLQNVLSALTQSKCSQYILKIDKKLGKSIRNSPKKPKLCIMEKAETPEISESELLSTGSEVKAASDLPDTNKNNSSAAMAGEAVAMVTESSDTVAMETEHSPSDSNSKSSDDVQACKTAGEETEAENLTDDKSAAALTLKHDELEVKDSDSISKPTNENAEIQQAIHVDIGTKNTDCESENCAGARPKSVSDSEISEEQGNSQTVDSEPTLERVQEDLCPASNTDGAKGSDSGVAMVTNVDEVVNSGKEELMCDSKIDVFCNSGEKQIAETATKGGNSCSDSCDSTASATLSHRDITLSERQCGIESQSQCSAKSERESWGCSKTENVENVFSGTAGVTTSSSSPCTSAITDMECENNLSCGITNIDTDNCNDSENICKTVDETEQFKHEQNSTELQPSDSNLPKPEDTAKSQSETITVSQIQTDQSEQTSVQSDASTLSATEMDQLVGIVDGNSQSEATDGSQLKQSDSNTVRTVSVVSPNSIVVVKQSTTPCPVSNTDSSKNRTSPEFGNIFEKLSGESSCSTGNSSVVKIVSSLETGTRGKNSVQKVTQMHVHFSVDEGKKVEKDEPRDLQSVHKRIVSGEYQTVASFSEDIVRIIQQALNDPEDQKFTRKKALNSARSVFMKQMEKVFPWFNVKKCKFWYSNLNLPSRMLPDATLPPTIDHTYHQWLEREDTPRSPQPSPFKKRLATPVKHSVVLDEEGEEPIFVDGEDSRRCLMCWTYGDKDSNEAGRLLYCGQDDWVHVNCALWSAEVFEEADGSLQNFMEAYSRGKMMKCDLCGKGGATVGCCTRGCPANYHFMCARNDRCVFQEDKKVFCKHHTSKVDGELVGKGRFSVMRRVYVHQPSDRVLKKTWSKGLNSVNINVVIGSCTVEGLGRLTELSDRSRTLLPVDYTCTRIYWSTRDARRRCVYTCRILEVKPTAKNSPKVTIKDMRIVHDETHPDYVPLEQLDLSGIDLGMGSTSVSKPTHVDLTSDPDSSSVIDLSGDSATSSSAYDRSAGHNLGASFSGRPSSPVTESKKLSMSWPSAQKNKEKSKPSGLSVDLSGLSPSTLKWLNLKDPSKYSQKITPVTNPQNDDEDLDLNLTRIADRLNMAAARNTRRKSEERTLPGHVTRNARSSRSPSVERITQPSNTRQFSPLTIQSGSVERGLRPFSPPARARRSRSSSMESMTSPPPVLPDVNKADDKASAPGEKEQSEEVMEVEEPTRETTGDTKTLSPVREIPTPVDFSSPILVGESMGSVPVSKASENDKDCVITGVTSPPTEEDLSLPTDLSLDLPFDLESILSEVSSSSNPSETIILMTDGNTDLTEEDAVRIAQAAIEQSNSSAEEGTNAVQGEISPGENDEALSVPEQGSSVEKAVQGEITHGENSKALSVPEGTAEQSFTSVEKAVTVQGQITPALDDDDISMVPERAIDHSSSSTETASTDTGHVNTTVDEMTADQDSRPTATSDEEKQPRPALHDFSKQASLSTGEKTYDESPVTADDTAMKEKITLQVERSSAERNTGEESKPLGITAAAEGLPVDLKNSTTDEKNQYCQMLEATSAEGASDSGKTGEKEDTVTTKVNISSLAEEEKEEEISSGHNICIEDKEDESKGICLEKSEDLQSRKTGSEPDKKYSSDSENVTPDSETVMPDSKRVTLDSENVAPDSENVTPDSEKVTQDSQNVVQDSKNVAPDSENVIQDSKKVTPAVVDSIQSSKQEKLTAVDDLERHSGGTEEVLLTGGQDAEVAKKDDQQLQADSQESWATVCLGEDFEDVLIKDEFGESPGNARVGIEPSVTGVSEMGAVEGEGGSSLGKGLVAEKDLLESESETAELSDVEEFSTAEDSGDEIEHLTLELESDSEDVEEIEPLEDDRSPAQGYGKQCDSVIQGTSCYHDTGNAGKQQQGVSSDSSIKDCVSQSDEAGLTEDRVIDRLHLDKETGNLSSGRLVHIYTSSPSKVTRKKNITGPVCRQQADCDSDHGLGGKVFLVEKDDDQSEMCLVLSDSDIEMLPDIVDSSEMQEETRVASPVSLKADGIELILQERLSQIETVTKTDPDTFQNSSPESACLPPVVKEPDSEEATEKYPDSETMEQKGSVTEEDTTDGHGTGVSQQQKLYKSLTGSGAQEKTPSGKEHDESKISTPSKADKAGSDTCVSDANSSQTDSMHLKEDNLQRESTDFAQTGDVTVQDEIDGSTDVSGNLHRGISVEFVQNCSFPERDEEKLIKSEEELCLVLGGQTVSRSGEGQGHGQCGTPEPADNSSTGGQRDDGISAERSNSSSATPVLRSPDKNIFDMFKELSPDSALLCKSEVDVRTEEEKREVFKGLGLWSSFDAAQAKILKAKAPLKSYPLRHQQSSPEQRRERTQEHIRRKFLVFDSETKKRKEEPESPVEEHRSELPVYDPLSQRIKMESLAKSSPSEKGPFKCTKCRRLYRTETSFTNHVQNCDFDVSTSDNDSDSDRDEKKRSPEEKKARSSMRRSTMNQRVAMENEKKQKAAMMMTRKPTEKVKTRASRAENVERVEMTVKKNQRRPKSPNLTSDTVRSPETPTLKPNIGNRSGNASDKSLEKRRRGRPPKVVSTDTGSHGNEKDAKERKQPTSPCRKPGRTHSLGKETADSQVDEVLVKRKRGRPPKNTGTPETPLLPRNKSEGIVSTEKKRQLLRTRQANLTGRRSLPGRLGKSVKKGLLMLKSVPLSMRGRPLKKKRFSDSDPDSDGTSQIGSKGKSLLNTRHRRMSLTPGSEVGRRPRTAGVETPGSECGKHPRTAGVGSGQVSRDHPSNQGNGGNEVSGGQPEGVRRRGRPPKNRQATGSTFLSKGRDSSAGDEMDKPASQQAGLSPGTPDAKGDNKVAKSPFRPPQTWSRKRAERNFASSSLSPSKSPSMTSNRSDRSSSSPSPSKSPGNAISRSDSSSSPSPDRPILDERTGVITTLNKQVKERLAQRGVVTEPPEYVDLTKDSDLPVVSGIGDSIVGGQEKPSYVNATGASGESSPVVGGVFQSPNDEGACKVESISTQSEPSKQLSEVEHMEIDTEEPAVAQDDIVKDGTPPGSLDTDMETTSAVGEKETEVQSNLETVNEQSQPSSLEKSENKSKEKKPENQSDCQEGNQSTETALPIGEKRTGSPIDLCDIQASIAESGENKLPLSKTVINLLREGHKVVIRSADNSKSVIWEKSGDKYVGRPYPVEKGNKAKRTETMVSPSGPSTVPAVASSGLQMGQHLKGTDVGHQTKKPGIEQKARHVPSIIKTARSRSVEEVKSRSSNQCSMTFPPVAQASVQETRSSVASKESVHSLDSRAQGKAASTSSDKVQGSSSLPASNITLPPHVIRIIKEMHSKQRPQGQGGNPSVTMHDDLSLTYVGSIRSRPGPKIQSVTMETSPRAPSVASVTKPDNMSLTYVGSIRSRPGSKIQPVAMGTQPSGLGVQYQQSANQPFIQVMVNPQSVAMPTNLQQSAMETVYNLQQQQSTPPFQNLLTQQQQTTQSLQNLITQHQQQQALNQARIPKIVPITAGHQLPSPGIITVSSGNQVSSPRILTASAGSQPALSPFIPVSAGSQTQFVAMPIQNQTESMLAYQQIVSQASLNVLQSPPLSATQSPLLAQNQPAAMLTPGLLPSLSGIMQGSMATMMGTNQIQQLAGAAAQLQQQQANQSPLTGNQVEMLLQQLQQQQALVPGSSNLAGCQPVTVPSNQTQLKTDCATSSGFSGLLSSLAKTTAANQSITSQGTQPLSRLPQNLPNFKPEVINKFSTTLQNTLKAFLNEKSSKSSPASSAISALLQEKPRETFATQNYTSLVSSATSTGIPGVQSLVATPSGGVQMKEIKLVSGRSLGQLDKSPHKRPSYSSKMSKILTKKAMAAKPPLLHRKRPLPVIGAADWILEDKNGLVQGQLNPRVIKVQKAEQTVQAIGAVSDTLPAKRRKFQKVRYEPVIPLKKKTVPGTSPRKLKVHHHRKSPQKLRNMTEPHGSGIVSHPILHATKNYTALPAAAVEEEVRATPLTSLRDLQGKGRDTDENIAGQDGARLVFEIVSDDGFTCRGDTLDGAWKQLIEKVQDARSAARLKQLSYGGVNGVTMCGLAHNSVRYLTEQLSGAQHCRHYRFKYHRHELPEEEEEVLIDNASGCIRTEPFTSRKTYDMFSFLMSRYRARPAPDAKRGDEEMIHKSSRRATSMDLPMAMRFRKLQAHSREAVGVYRSSIHGRGLFCKRNIDGGEMIIEYAGEVIRSSLTDIREKYYESKGIGCYMFRIDDTDVVDATMHGSAARFINHSCEPNCYSKVITVEQRKHIVIFASRPIKRGEELTYDYKFPIEEVKIPCTCGSKRCRKYLN